MSVTRSSTTRPVRFATVAVTALVLAACGGDADADVATPASEDDASQETASEETAASGEDGADAGAASGDGDDAGSAGDGATGVPSTLMSELDPIELPAPGTARATLAGETYEWDFAAFEFSVCRISNPFGERDEAEQFQAVVAGETTDGHATRLELIRQVDHTEDLRIFGDHEWEFLQLTVSQEPGGSMYSNAIADGRRPEVGGPVRGDFDSLPVIKVAEVDGRLAATAIAELSHPPFTGDFDRAGEGVAEIALVCP